MLLSHNKLSIIKHINSSTVLIFAAVAYSYARTWVHQDDGATSFTPLSPFPYVVFSVYLAVLAFKVYRLYREGVFDHKRPQYYLALLLCAITAGVYYVLLGDFSLLMAVSLGIGLQNDNTDNIIKCTGIIALCFIIIQIVGYYLGIFYDIKANDSNWMRPTMLGDSRAAFGFGHPNRPFTFLIPVWISVFYYQGRVKLLLGGICSVLSLLIFGMTGSRTILVLLVLLPLGSVFNRLPLSSRSIKWLLRLIFPISLVISIGISLVFGNGNNLVQDALSGRPQWWGYYIENGFQLVGMTVGCAQVFEGGLPLDNYTLDVLYRGGILITIIMSVWYAVFISYLLTKHDNKTIYSVIYMFVCGLSESAIRFVSAPFLPLLTIAVLQIAENSGHDKPRCTAD